MKKLLLLFLTCTLSVGWMFSQGSIDMQKDYLKDGGNIANSVKQSSEAEILSFIFEALNESEQVININSDAATVDIVVVYGTNITSLNPSITISDGASIDPDPDVDGPFNFTVPVEFTVTAEDGVASKDWEVTVEVCEDDVVWVADIAELRAQNDDGTTVYFLASEAILTYQESWRNSKYIDDGTAGILIDDYDGIIQTEYEIYDGITGIKGTLSTYGNMLQFVPEEDPGAATSSGNIIDPLVITLEDFVNNFMDYQAKLVTIENVYFGEDDVGENFSNGSDYDIIDGDDDQITGEFRTTFYNVDYIGTPIPPGLHNITGLPNSRSTGDFITARHLGDFESLASYSVTFEVIDEENTPVDNAVITLDGETNDPNDYYFEEVRVGARQYSISKAGYHTTEGILLLPDGDITYQAVLVEISDNMVVDFPWEEDFEEEPVTWSQYEYGAGGWARTGTSNTGDYAMWHNFATDEAESWAVTPQIKLPEDEKMVLNFFERNNFMDDYGYSGVKISTNSGNPVHEKFVEIYESDRSISSYSEMVIDLAEYAGKVIYIAFVYQGENAHQWYIDDIVIEEVEIIEVDNIAHLREFESLAGSDLEFKITGEVFITHQQLAYRGQMYLQDETGAILVDDPSGVITTEYDNYDGIVGLTFNLALFQSMLQIVPTEDPGPPNSTGNEPIEPLEVALDELSDEHQGMLVVVRYASFDFDHPGFPDDHYFTHNESFFIYDPAGEGEIRTPNYEGLLDYFGEPIPTEPKDIVGNIHQRYEALRLVPRSLADFMEPLELYNLTLVANPVEGGEVSGGGRYDEGEEVTVTATANEGYNFVNWTDEGDNEVSDQASFDYTMPGEDVTLTANFELINLVEDLAGAEIRLYPNPANNEFTIESDKIIKQVSIVSISGQIVFDQAVNDNSVRIDAGFFEPGIYVVRIISENDIVNHKLQIQR